MLYFSSLSSSHLSCTGCLNPRSSASQSLNTDKHQIKTKFQLSNTEHEHCTLYTTHTSTVLQKAPDRKPQHDEGNQYDMYGNIIPTQPSNPRANQIRLLIPIGAAGVMIGRAGSVIKSMSEETSCHMQLAPTDNG
jgi:hypothetical protein